MASYIAVPLRRRDGSLFGTLCALDTIPAPISEDAVAVVELMSSLIAYELEAEDERVRRTQELEAAYEEAAARERLMGMLGHDLRTPLTAVTMGASDVLAHEPLTDSAQRTLASVLASARRASRMIADLLDFTRARLGGGIPVQRVETDLLAVTRKVASEVRAANPQRTIVVEAKGATDGRWDPDRVAQAVSNLLGNAVEHGTADTPIEVSLTGDGDSVCLDVRNSAPPIPEGILDTLFSPFVRQGTGGEGLGLGLFIVRQIVEAHGGRVLVSSNDSGTCFTTIWPRE